MYAARRASCLCAAKRFTAHKCNDYSLVQLYMYVCKYVMYNVLQKKAFNADLLSIKHVVFMVGDKVTTYFGFGNCLSPDSLSKHFSIALVKLVVECHQITSFSKF